MSVKCTKCGFLLATVVILLLLYYWLPTSSQHHILRLHYSGEPVSVNRLLASALLAAQLGGIQVRRMSAVAEMQVRSKGKTAEGANDPVTEADLRSHCAMWSQLTADFPTVRVVSEEDGDTAKCAGLQPLPEEEGKKVEQALRPVDVTEATRGIEELALAKDVTVWIDPLDATQEYTEHLYQYVTVMVCVAIRGRPVLGVIHNPFTAETRWAWNRQSVSGSSSDIPVASSQTSASASASASAVTCPASQYNRTVIVSRSHHGGVEQLVHTAFDAATTRLVPAGGAGYKVLQVLDGRADAYVHSTRIKKWDLCAGNALLEAAGGRLSGVRGERLDYAAAASVVNELGVLAALREAEHAQFVARMPVSWA